MTRKIIISFIQDNPNWFYPWDLVTFGKAFDVMRKDNTYMKECNALSKNGVLEHGIDDHGYALYRKV